MTKCQFFHSVGEEGGGKSRVVAAWVLAVAAILAPDNLLWLRLLGWCFAAYRIWKEPQEGLLLLALFTPVFTHLGVIPIGYALMPLNGVLAKDLDPNAVVFFSIKPVQFITVLLIASLSRRKMLFFKDPLDWLAVGSLLGIFMISLIAGAYSEDPLKAFRVALNLGLMILLCKILMSVIDKRELFWRMLGFYFAGVVGLCVLYAANLFLGTTFFDLDGIRFNNHFGFLLSMSLPLGLAIFFTRKSVRAKILVAAMLAFTFFCTILTLSRSAMYSSVLGMILFLAIAWARAKASPQEKRKIGLALLGALAGVALSAFLYEGINVLFMGGSETSSLFRGKLISFFEMFKPSYWEHSIFYDSNGGMLGQRFIQLGSVKEIFLQHWLFGEGWTNRVISFHGLYYTILTGTGICGFALFAYFTYRLFRTLWNVSKRDTDPGTKILAIGLFCALLDWMLHNLLDTYFLQFHVWLVLGMALAYIKLVFRSQIPAMP